MGSHFGHALRFEQSQLVPSPQQTRPNWLHVLSQVAVQLQGGFDDGGWPGVGGGMKQTRPCFDFTS